MMRVIFSIYFGVAVLITVAQFSTEYLKTKDSISNELKQLEETVRGPISTSLWQYNENQLNALVAGLSKTPIIAGVDVLDNNGDTILSKRTYTPDSAPLSLFDTQSELYWSLNEQEILLG